jgi:LacI family transcriptional regulator, repressor for deo operon, udp, cdd, tsx, nupC, and nupG
MKSTIEDVAKRAGVSTATVSRALRGFVSVTPETKSRVEQAARELDYVISASASRLASGKTFTVGVITPFIDRWYFSNLLSGIERVTRSGGFELLVYSLDRLDERERIFHQKLLREQVDALLVCAMPPSQKEIDFLQELKIPVALVGAEVAGCASVRIDDIGGAKAATGHLINMGHQRIGLIAESPLQPMSFTAPRDRRNGFLNAHLDAGLTFDPALEAFGSFTIESGERAMDELLARPHPPTAVFCESDEMAFGAMSAIRRHGLRVPEDISIVGFDDHDLAKYLNLTTVSQSVQVMGETAAWIILDQLKNESNEPKSVVMPTQLVVRASTARVH